MAGRFTFTARLHPRGRGGRFIETPDAPPKKKRAPLVTVGISTQRTGRARDSVEANITGVMASLSEKQRQRLQGLLQDSAKKTQDAINARRAPAPNLVGGAQDRTLTTPRRSKARTGKTKVTISEAGVHTEVKHAEGFKVTKTQGYKYTVEHSGKEIGLNAYSTTMEYGGYKVRGVPDIIPNVKKATTPEVVDKLAMAQHMASKGNAPLWRPDAHGSIDPDLVGRRKANPGVPHYGVMQIHHVEQWALDPANRIEADLKSGKITPDQAEKRYLATIEPRPRAAAATTTGDEEDDEGGTYQLKLRPKEDREFVILAGGTHQGGTPLYLANHPKFYDPDADKFKPIGIPHVGEGSREWFEKEFRKPFWKEYAKHQVTQLGTELDKRVNSGVITAKEAQRLFDDAQGRIKGGTMEW